MTRRRKRRRAGEDKGQDRPISQPQFSKVKHAQ